MSKFIRLSLFLACLLLITGCKSNNTSSVSEVPPPSPSGPITASHDPGINGPVALGGTTKKPGYTDPGTGDIFTPGPASPSGPTAAAFPPGAGGQHVVRQGETLWSISKAHYGTGQRWKDIVAANPGLTPEKMKVGMAIALP
jgi:nucleoid-associated protein YgaU